jgi:hypothetical protein
MRAGAADVVLVGLAREADALVTRFGRCSRG